MQEIVILTGAGISAESGLRTFRDQGGLWEGEQIEDVATPEAFARDPQRVHRFYNERRAGVFRAKPNAAHFALAELEQHCPSCTLITQNVDDLHERAGSKMVLHMHGSILDAFCIFCNARTPVAEDIHIDTPCPQCMRSSSMRPDIVWFGEMPKYMDIIGEKLASADIFLTIGSSGTVYPAAGFAQQAALAGAHTVILNKEAIGMTSFDSEEYGNASEIVPAWVEKYIGGYYEG